MLINIFFWFCSDSLATQHESTLKTLPTDTSLQSAMQTCTGEQFHRSFLVRVANFCIFLLRVSGFSLSGFSGKIYNYCWARHGNNSSSSQVKLETLHRCLPPPTIFRYFLKIKKPPPEYWLHPLPNAILVQKNRSLSPKTVTKIDAEFGSPVQDLYGVVFRCRFRVGDWRFISR